MKKAIVLSIRPEYAEKIFSGEKTVELRRSKPRELSAGSLILVYITSPKQELYGAFTVSKVLEAPIDQLWGKIHKKAAVKKEVFEDYFKNKQRGVGIFIGQVWCLRKPWKLKDLKRNSDFYPPQFFRYMYKGNKVFNQISEFMSRPD